jgi:hypothetical protein
MSDRGVEQFNKKYASYLKNDYGDTISVNALGDIEFFKAGSQGTTFYVSRHDVKALAIFLLEALGRRDDGLVADMFTAPE